jgi:hypothetical protein
LPEIPGDGLCRNNDSRISTGGHFGRLMGTNAPTAKGNNILDESTVSGYD